MTYSPTATGAGQEGYWGDVYGSSSVENQFPVGSWKSKDGKYSGNLGTARYYPIVNKETGDIAVVKVGSSENSTVGTISGKDGDFKSIEGATSQAENYYFNLPENAAKVTNHALNIAQKEYDALGAAQKSATGNPNGLINALNNIAGFSVTPAGAAGVDESIPAPPSNTKGNFGRGGVDRSNSLLIFPTGLASNGQDHIEFASLDYVPTTLQSSRENVGFVRSGMDKRIHERIVLPIPGGITDNNAVNWGEANMTAAEIAKAGIALGAIEGGGEGFKKSLDDVAGAIGGNSEAVKDVLAKQIAGKVSGTGDQLMKRGQGQVMNPNMELLFNGPQLRTFGFTFKLSPRTQEEATTIQQIIRRFKEAMAPRKIGPGLFLKSPRTWRLRYINQQGQDHQFLNRFKECAMMSSSVNYTPDGSYATYSDGSMVSYQLTLNFQEIEPVFDRDYQNATGIGY